MSQVQRGDQGSGKKPGVPARKASPAKGSPAKSNAKGRPPAGPGAKGRPPTSGGAKGRAPRQNMQITAAPPRRFSPSTLAFGSIAVVVVIIVVFVVITVTTKKTVPPSQIPTTPTAAPASLVHQVTNVPDSVFSAVGTGQGVTAPTVLKGQPQLTSAGKPEMLYIGAEFCPFCAAERWGMVVALSRFGTWSNLKVTTSSPWDADPATATFSFRDAKFTSQYFNLVTVEHETNDVSGLGTRKALQPLTTAEGNLWTKYAAQFGIQTGYPFISVGNRVFVTGPSYDPAVIAGLGQGEIAAKLTNPSDPVTQAIVGTANYLSAAICAETGNQPAAVCSASGTHKATTALKLG